MRSIPPFPVVAVLLMSTLGSNFKVHLALSGVFIQDDLPRPLSISGTPYPESTGSRLVYLLENAFMKKPDIIETT